MRLNPDNYPLKKNKKEQSPSNKLIGMFARGQERCIQKINTGNDIKKAVSDYVAFERYKNIVKHHRKIFDKLFAKGEE